MQVSFDDAKGRYNVKLDGSGDLMSLKPANLMAADGGAGAPGSGMPGGFGGMPGGFGGMPDMGGMPGMGGGAAQAAMMQQLLARLFGGAGIPALPAGVTPQTLGGLAMLVFFVLPKLLGIGMLQSALIGGIGGFTLLGAAGGKGVGGIVANGRQIVRSFGGTISRVSGRPVSDAQAALFMAAAVYLLWTYVFASGGSNGVGSDAAPSYAAYRKGYEDGKAGKPYAPISDEVVASSGSGRSSGWGIGSLLNMMMAGSMLYQWAGTPPSVENLIANARNANPMQLLILFQIVSSLLF